MLRCICFNKINLRRSEGEKKNNNLKQRENWKNKFVKSGLVG